jgi:hypothetical protein
MSQVTDVEQTMVRRTVVAAQSSAVHAQLHVQVLNGDIVDRHVVGALEKSGINREERLQTLCRQAAGKKRGVFFCDTHIEIATRMRLLKMR